MAIDATPAALFDRAKALLLDFDGPVADLLPPPVEAEAASRARAGLRGVDLPHEVATTTDYLDVLEYALENHPETVPRVEAACTAAEVDAARSCEPSPHAHDLFDYAERRSIPLGIVSNNAEEAVRVFLDRLGWEHRIGAYACRPSGAVDWMKPSPRLLRLAADALQVEPSEAVFVGDSVSDAEAANAAGAPVIGLAKGDEDRRRLHEAGADAVVLLGDRSALFA